MWRQIVLASWFFYVLNATGDPHYFLEDFLSKGDCEAARTWVIQAHFKTDTPDAAQAKQYASPCFQSYILQQ